MSNLDASGMIDIHEIIKLLKEAKENAAKYGPYTTDDWNSLPYNELFGQKIIKMHTVQNVFGCSITITKDLIATIPCYRIGMSRINPVVLQDLSQDRYKDSDSYRGVIPRQEFLAWIEAIFGKHVIEDNLVNIVDHNYVQPPRVPGFDLDLTSANARHRWEAILREDAV